MKEVLGRLASSATTINDRRRGGPCVSFGLVLCFGLMISHSILVHKGCLGQYLKIA
jgi:hypothetical protein